MNGIQNIYDIPISGDDQDYNLIVENLTVNDQFYINSINIGNNQLQQLQGIHTDETIQSQIDGLINVTSGKGYWGCFWSSITQTPTNTNTPYHATLNNYDQDGNAINLYQISTGSNYNYIKVSYGAVYNIQFSIQTSTTSSSKSNIKVWLTKNGVNIPNTAGMQSISLNDGLFIMSYNIILTLQNNDYIGLMWSVDDTNLHLEALPETTTPYNSPLSPSVIITLQQVQYYQDNTAVVNELQEQVETLETDYNTFKSITNSNISNLQQKTTGLTYSSGLTTINGDLNVSNNYLKNGVNLDNIYANKAWSEEWIDICYTNAQNAQNTANQALTGANNAWNLAVEAKNQSDSNTAGLIALGVTTGANSVAITALGATVATHTAEIGALQGEIGTLTTSITGLDADVTLLKTKTQNQNATLANTTFNGGISCNSIDTDTINLQQSITGIGKLNLSSNSGSNYIYSPSTTIKSNFGNGNINLGGLSDNVYVNQIPFNWYFSSQW